MTAPHPLDEHARALDPGALHALQNNQRQLDADGVEVGVSRQALYEIIAAYIASEAAREKAETLLRDRDGQVIAWQEVANDGMKRADKAEYALRRWKEANAAKPDWEMLWEKQSKRAEIAEAQIEEWVAKYDELLEHAKKAETIGVEQAEIVLQLLDRNKATEGEAARLRTALKLYGRCLTSCEIYLGRVCDCDLAQFLATPAAPEGEK